MDGPRLEIEGRTITLVGSFNPKIFQPAWFAAQGLIRQEEEEAAEIKLIHPAVASFTTAWLVLEVTADRFSAGTTQNAFYEPLRDLVLGTFRLLRHTPIRMMGLNRDSHFRMPSEEAWHAFGHRLAPKEVWEGILESPGVRSLTMEGQRPDGLNGYIRVRVEPSARVPPGVFVQINDHYVVEQEETLQGSDEIINILDQEWRNAVERSLKITDSLMGIK